LEGPERPEINSPANHNPKRIIEIFHPDLARISALAAEAGMPPAETDKVKIHLVIVDMQVDFCHENGTLFVPGAAGDVKRLIEFIYRNAQRITGITCSLDSHLPHQIFHPVWWADAEGKHPAPFTVITHGDIIAGKWRPLEEPEWSVQYPKRLQELAKKELTIWPYHVIIGSTGHTLEPELFSAVFWHSIARKSQPNWWVKGNIPKTEHYSIVQPEILVPEHPQGVKSQEFLNIFRTSDCTFIAGEAASHCMLETLKDIIEEFDSRPDILNRIFVLEDCTSPIRHPAVDYEAITRHRFAEFGRRGVHFVKSTDPFPAQV
jgi:nicotinamidase/pyrazinamidase